MSRPFSYGSLAVALVACTADDPGAATDEDVVNVTIESMAFSPKSVTVKVGQRVRWTWAGGEHNVVAGSTCDKPDATVLRSGAPQSGGTFEKKFEKAGTIPYFCEVHCSMGMTGEIKVE